MKRILIYCMLFAQITCFALAEKKMDQASGIKTVKKTSKWYPLFNGKDFNDWSLYTKNGDAEALKKIFCIDKGGVIHFFRDLPDGYVLEDPNGLHGSMISKRSYSRYILTFEYKWGSKLVNNYKKLQYDSGLYFHISEAGAYPLGIQYQIRYDHLKNISFTGELRGKFDRNWYSKDGVFQMPSEGGVARATPNGINSPASYAFSHGSDGKWNKCEIIVMGSEYVIYKLNGKVVNMVSNLSWSEGAIGLEAESGEILWRNIMIKEFKESVPKEKFLY